MNEADEPEVDPDLEVVIVELPDCVPVNDRVTDIVSDEVLEMLMLLDKDLLGKPLRLQLMLNVTWVCADTVTEGDHVGVLVGDMDVLVDCEKVLLRGDVERLQVGLEHVRCDPVTSPVNVEGVKEIDCVCVEDTDGDRLRLWCVQVGVGDAVGVLVDVAVGLSEKTGLPLHEHEVVLLWLVEQLRDMLGLTVRVVLVTDGDFSLPDLVLDMLRVLADIVPVRVTDLEHVAVLLLGVEVCVGVTLTVLLPLGDGAVTTSVGVADEDGEHV